MRMISNRGDASAVAVRGHLGDGQSMRAASARTAQ